MQSVVDDIDPKYFNDTNRFGAGFYVAEKGDVAIAEVTHHGINPDQAKMIRFELDKSKLKILDLTDPEIAKKWEVNEASQIEKQFEEIGKENQKYDGFKEISKKAQEQGYNAIKFTSKRADGNNFVIFGDNKEFFQEVLQPKMVTPATK